jgi:hypothetical protein
MLLLSVEGMQIGVKTLSIDNNLLILVLQKMQQTYGSFGLISQLLLFWILSFIG